MVRAVPPRFAATTAAAFRAISGTMRRVVEQPPDRALERGRIGNDQAGADAIERCVDVVEIGDRGTVQDRTAELRGLDRVLPAAARPERLADEDQRARPGRTGPISPIVSAT